MSVLGVHRGSIAEVWKQHQALAGGVAAPLADLKLRRLAFTQSLPLVPGQANYKDSARGAVRGCLELAYENPLRPFVEEVATRLRELERSLEDLRVNYLDPTADLIRQTSVDAGTGLAGCQNSLRDIDAIVRQIRP